MGNLFERIQPVRCEGGRAYFLDQTLLPAATEWVEVASAEACRDAIARLVVRGAPAIGIGAAFGLAAEARRIARGGGGADEERGGGGRGDCDGGGGVAAEARGGDVADEAFFARLRAAKGLIASARPTAVNLFWALERVEGVALALAGAPAARVAEALFDEARAMLREDAEICRRIGEHGQAVLRDGMGLLTHCNAGALATSMYGTALAPVYVAKERGISVRVFADETRPLLQGARLTAYELMESGVDVTLIADGMAADVMSKGWVQACIVGCDRVARNGDTANKIGTLGVAVLARHFGVPFYVACPFSTIDRALADGGGIPIEERDGDELRRVQGARTAPEGVKVYNPAFDVTPGGLVTGFITEAGILRPPFPPV